MLDRLSRPVTNIRPIGNTALLAAALIAVIQLVDGNPAQGAPNLIAVLLCVVGQGMRIESAIAEQKSDT